MSEGGLQMRCKFCSAGRAKLGGGSPAAAPSRGQQQARWPRRRFAGHLLPRTVRHNLRLTGHYRRSAEARAHKLRAASQPRAASHGPPAYACARAHA